MRGVMRGGMRERRGVMRGNMRGERRGVVRGERSDGEAHSHLQHLRESRLALVGEEHPLRRAREGGDVGERRHP